MLKNKIIIIFSILCIGNILDTAYKFNMPKYIPKIIKPTSFKKYHTTQKLFTPIEITSQLQQKSIAIQNKIMKHPFYKDFIIELENPVIINYITPDQPIFDKKFLMKQEIFMYCLKHPEQAEDIMNFYQEIKNADDLIKNRVELLPQHAQEFFKQQVEKTIDSKLKFYDQDIEQVKAKILNSYPYVTTAFKLTFFMITLIMFFLDETYFYAGKSSVEIKFALKNSQDRHLIEIVSIIIDALNLDPVELKRAESHIYNEIAAYDPMFRTITLSPRFFSLSLDSQIFILLHELRHYQQFTQNPYQITIPEDIIKYAKEYGIAEPEASPFEFYRFILQGKALTEFDADLFAAQQMKHYPWMNKVANEIKKNKDFDAKTGYLSKEMILNESLHKTSSFLDTFEYRWNSFINKLSNDNLYLAYIPEHLKEAADKNRLAKTKAQ